jgi:GntR family transcriptional regulator/MocR family aminotransferase
MQLSIAIDPDGASTLPSQIVGQMRLLIEQGQLVPGSPIPTTRDLGKQLGVSRNTITGAYETLIGQGYLYTERAVGTFVCKTLPSALTSGGAIRPGGVWPGLPCDPSHPPKPFAVTPR